METYVYRCPVCGFIHFVPAYWVSFSPEAALEQAHINQKTGNICENAVLALQAEE